MKKEKQKLQVGDVVKNGRNNFQRLIREVGYVEKDGNLEVRYSYSNRSTRFTYCRRIYGRI